MSERDRTTVCVFDVCVLQRDRTRVCVCVSCSEIMKEDQGESG